VDVAQGTLNTARGYLLLVGSYLVYENGTVILKLRDFSLPLRSA
jgi:hypothetical protein